MLVDSPVFDYLMRGLLGGEEKVIEGYCFIELRIYYFKTTGGGK
jgi:hypothetical protein